MKGSSNISYKKQERTSHDSTCGTPICSPHSFDKHSTVLTNNKHIMINDPERSLQGEVTSDRFGGNAGGHIKEGTKVQAHSTWATRSRKPTNDINVEHIDTNDLGV